MSKHHTNMEIIESVLAQMPTPDSRRKFWAETISLSMASLTRNIARFEEAVAAKDLRALGETAHSLNGTVSFLGVANLSETLRELQNNCENKTLSLPFPGQAEILATLRAIVGELRQAELRDVG